LPEVRIVSVKNSTGVRGKKQKRNTPELRPRIKG